MNQVFLNHAVNVHLNKPRQGKYQVYAQFYSTLMMSAAKKNNYKSLSVKLT